VTRCGRCWPRRYALVATLAGAVLLAPTQPASAAQENAASATARQAPPALSAAASGAPTPGVTGPPGSQEEPFAESIEVSVVSIDVAVRDRAGHQVRGLGRGDFRLFVDGKPTEITNFYRTGEEPEPPQPSAAGNAADAGAAGELKAPTALSLVVYIDNANLRPFDRNRILKQVRTFLQKTLAPSDRLLVVTHDAGLHVRHSFQEDRSALDAELDRIEKESAAGIANESATRQTMELMKTVGCRQTDQLSSLAQAHAEAVFAEVRGTYANLFNLLGSLGGISGRKALVYVGDGVPLQVGTDVFGLQDELCHSVPGRSSGHPLDASPLLHKVTAAANANLVTLYTLEATGLRAYASAADARPLVSFDLSRRIDADRQDSLVSLAWDTGGRAALNGNDFSRDLDQITEDLRNSYSLGFAPAHPGDGKTHQVRVAVSRGDLRPSYRQTYRERTAEERFEGQVEAALVYGDSNNSLAASLKLGTGTPAEHGHLLLPVQVQVPFAKLALAEQADGLHGRVRIVVGTMDAKGGMSQLQRVLVPLSIPSADAKKALASQLGYQLKLLLEPGRQRIAIGVSDEVTHLSASIVQDLDLDKQGAAVVIAAPAEAPPHLR
jgi:VWFA-related protein